MDSTPKNPAKDIKLSVRINASLYEEVKKFRGITDSEKIRNALKTGVIARNRVIKENREYKPRPTETFTRTEKRAKNICLGIIFGCIFLTGGLWWLASVIF